MDGWMNGWLHQQTTNNMVDNYNPISYLCTGFGCTNVHITRLNRKESAQSRGLTQDYCYQKYTACRVLDEHLYNYTNCLYIDIMRKVYTIILYKTPKSSYSWDFQITDYDFDFHIQLFMWCIIIICQVNYFKHLMILHVCMHA